MVDVKNVSYAYNDILALDDISLHINSGESIAFIGPNGSGKSTFLKLINGIIFPDKGEYIFDGEKITEKKLQDDSFCKKFHKRIGFVFQNSEAQLFCSNVYDEIAFGPRQMRIGEEEINKRINDCMMLLDIMKLGSRQPYHLSGGEKKKVAIASTLVLNPDILVLDEPMNGLDPKTKRFIRELIINLNKAGKTILCSTHDFEYVKGVFKRAVVFSDSHRIVRDDDYDAVIKDTNFLYENNII